MMRCAPTEKNVTYDSLLLVKEIDALFGTGNMSIEGDRIHLDKALNPRSGLVDENVAFAVSEVNEVKFVDQVIDESVPNGVEGSGLDIGHFKDSRL